MKKIPLTQGKFAIVDDADFEWLNQWKWCYDRGYASRGIWSKETKKVKRQSMHRLIMGNLDSFIDHINGDALDNRRVNLRPVTASQNAINRKTRSDNNTGQKGVRFRHQYNLWQARICKNGKRVSLGHFKTKEEAIRAYKEAVPIWHGDFARGEV